MNKPIYDLIIIGGGPAAISAGIYAARKKLKTLFLTDSFLSQSVVSPDIKNWVGEISISGNDLAAKWEKHLRNYEGGDLIIKTGNRVKQLEKIDEVFQVTTDQNEICQTKTILVSTGAHHRRLTIPGAAEFEQKGINYCASCDGPLFKNKDVAVVGGGNAGFEAAHELTIYANSVTLLNRSDIFKADKITVDKVMTNPKITVLKNSEPLEIKGDKTVQSLIYKNTQTNETKEIPVQGIFVEIGFVPNTDFIKNLVKLDEHQAIIVDHQNQRASTPGIWAAGDCAASLYHQNNIAAGQGVVAVEDIYVYLTRK